MSDQATKSTGLLAVGTTAVEPAVSTNTYMRAMLSGVILIPAAAACSVQVDDKNAARTFRNAVVYLNGTANGATVSVTFNKPLEIEAGISVTVTGTGAQAILIYSIT